MTPAPLPCPVCHGGAVAPLGDRGDWAARIPADGDRAAYLARMLADPRLAIARFMACAACGFRWAVPAPAPDRLAAFYQDYGGSRRYAAKAGRKLFRAHRRLARLRRLLGRRAGARFLDVGCNLGFAVEAARRLGFQATGVELDAAAVADATARFPAGEFLVGTAADVVAGGRYFDLVYCSEMIEHVSDPAALVAQLARLTRPGGLLYLTTPDATPRRSAAAFLAWPEVKPPEHLCWFTRDSLRRLLAAAGFDRISFQFRWRPAKTGIRLVAWQPGVAS